MTQVPPSPMIAIDDEKNPRIYGDETEVAAETNAKVEAEITTKSVGSSDGDDALKLVGNHVHHFDEKYFLRLRRKIVSHPPSRVETLKRDSVTNLCRTFMSCLFSSSYTLPSS